MSFVSYAQNFEDVMLWRALKHVESGFYIDVGANDPEIDSVTKTFYDHGWCGINIEPAPQFFEKLQKMRPRDINLQLTAGSQQGEILFYELPNSGLSTILKATAERHEAEHGLKKIEHFVPVETITSICERFHVEIVHFLKIDVEGAEKNVVSGIEFSVVRPWIIVVESTLPMTQIQDHIQWEPILLASNYDYVYFDGLNRFYVSQDRPELKVHFNAPPNIFDDFALSGFASQPFYRIVESRVQEQESRAVSAEARATAAEVRAEQAEFKAQEAEERAGQAEAKAQEAHAKAQEAEARAGQAEAKAHEAHAKAQEAEARAGQAEAALAAIYNSRSWRISAPLRWAGNVARWFARGSIAWLTFAPGSRPRRILRRMLISIKSGISDRPLLKAVAARLLSPFPQLDARLRSMGNAISTGGPPITNPRDEGTEGLEHLSPRARKIYFDLKTAVEQRQKEHS